MSRKTQTISWFSAGVSSAVATKLAIEEIDRIFYIHIDDQHEDTLRFVAECEDWFGKPIERMQSPYKCVENAVYGHGRRGFIRHARNGFAPCTTFLKQRVRREWESEQREKLAYVWGMDLSEAHRADRLRESMPEQTHLFPMIERGISKTHAHEILNASGIKRPAMYELGYHNNNCVGCVKGGMGYWNKIREDFPDVFAARAKMERRVGGSCLKECYLDELDPKRGRHQGPIVDDCGIMCELVAL